MGSPHFPEAAVGCGPEPTRSSSHSKRSGSKQTADPSRRAHRAGTATLGRTLQSIVVGVPGPALIVRVRCVGIVEGLEHLRQQLAVVRGSQPDDPGRTARARQALVGHGEELLACGAKFLCFLIAAGAIVREAELLKD